MSFIVWIALCTAQVAAGAVVTSRLRRRPVETALHSDDNSSCTPRPQSNPGGGYSKALVAVGASVSIVLLALPLVLLLARWKDSWGRSQLLVGWRRQCSPPTPAARQGAWGPLGGLNLTIITHSPQAQQLFQQGLLLAWGFNRAESLESFRGCLRFDPGAAMCQWGVAYAQGPFLNLVTGTRQEGGEFPVVGPGEFDAAGAAVEQASRLAEKFRALQRDPQSRQAAWERTLCTAAAARFAPGSLLGNKRAEAERGYAESMQALGEKEEDATALALAAEGFLNLVPWDFVDPSSGDKRPEAAAAEALLLRALRAEPQHALALHLHVHLAEAQAPAAAGAQHGGGAGTLREGEASADRLGGLFPRLPHLVHMPSHLYIRVGRYLDAVAANIKAWEGDRRAAAGCLQTYIPEHNLHMLLFAASMGGQLSVVREWADTMWRLPELLPRSAWPGRERTLLLLAQVRFARWDEVLATPPPLLHERGPGVPGGHAYATAVWRFARCLALASRAQRAQHAKRTAEARHFRTLADREVVLLHAAVAALPADTSTRPGQGKGIYSYDNRGLAAVAVAVAEARLLSLDARWAEAVEKLQAAVELETGMGYLEPPRLLHQPVRQCLGWALLQWGRYNEAAETYRSDLQQYPLNGWSLLGLSQALMRSGHSREAAAERERLQEAWRGADQLISSSCPAFAGQM